MDYGKCPNCGGPKVFNPKTGKVFCQNKCWLGNQPKQANKTVDDYNKALSEDISNSQTRKEDSIRTAGAKRDAGLIVAEMIRVGEIPASTWFAKYKEIATEIYNWSPDDRPPFKP